MGGGGGARIRSDTNMVRLNLVNQKIVSRKLTTLSAEYSGDKGGEPAVITTGGAGYLCPSCGLDHLKRHGKLVIDPDNRLR